MFSDVHHYFLSDAEREQKRGDLTAAFEENCNKVYFGGIWHNLFTQMGYNVPTEVVHRVPNISNKISYV